MLMITWSILWIRAKIRKWAQSILSTLASHSNKSFKGLVSVNKLIPWQRLTALEFKVNDSLCRHTVDGKHSRSVWAIHALPVESLVKLHAILRKYIIIPFRRPILLTKSQVTIVDRTVSTADVHYPCWQQCVVLPVVITELKKHVSSL